LLRTRRGTLAKTPIAIKLLIPLAAIAAGCAGGLAEAPFPLRPDTVAHGSLLGPFQGRVVDAATGKPVAGATVLAAWALETGRGLVGPAGAASRTVESDADGRYRIAALEPPRDPRLRVARATLLVWKQGYAGYRSDRRFPSLEVRHDFAQFASEVRLEPLGDSDPRAPALAFFGAGGPLLAHLEGELARTANDGAAPSAHPSAPAAPATTAPPPPEARAPLDVRVLLSVDELKAVTGFDGVFTLAPLGDLPDGPSP
jgi:hypothetical protein